MYNYFTKVPKCKDELICDVPCAPHVKAGNAPSVAEAATYMFMNPLLQ